MKRTLAVLLVLAGLGAYVYFFEIKAKGEKAAADKEAKQLLTLDRADIDRIALTNEHGELVLVKSGEAWSLAKPVSAPADEQSVRSLLTALGTAETSGQIDKVDNLAAFGLENPKISIALAAGSRDEVIRLGKRSPVSQDLYVQRGGPNQAVLQTAASLEGPAGKAADEFRDKRLFTFSADDVTAITIVDAGKSLHLMRSGDDWFITAPRKLDADDGIAKGVAADLANLRATAFVAEDAGNAELAAKGLKNPESQVTVAMTDGTTHTLLVGKLENGERAVKAAAKPQIVTVADWSAKNLLKDELELRERKLVQAPKAKIAKMVFQNDASTTTYTRGGGGWSVGENTSTPADTARVEELLTAVDELRATEWHPSTPQTRREHGLATPHRTLTLFDESGQQLAKINFGADAESWAVWAQAADPSVEAKTPNDLVKNIWP